METFPGKMPEVVDEDAQEAIYTNLDVSLLRDAIETLPEEIKRTVLLHYFMDMPVKEVARVLSSPTSTITWRLHYARRILAAKLGVAADKAKDAAKKPGVKATLLALALCALTALGAGTRLAVVRLLSSPTVAAEQQADNSKEGPRFRATAIGETGESSPVAPVPTPVPPDSPVSPVLTAAPLSNSPTLPLLRKELPNEYTRHPSLVTTLAAFAAAAASAAIPEVSNVTMSQAGNRQVTITYQLANAPAVVTLDIQTNANTSATANDPGWTSIGGQFVCNAQGDVWKQVSGKATYTITWQPDKSWTGDDGEGFKIEANGARARVTAWPLDNTPDYMVVDISSAANFTTERFMRPMEQVSYNEIRNAANSTTANTAYDWPAAPNPSSFLGLLRSKTGIDFDLPSEAQWEFAARAGNGAGYWNDGSPILNADLDANLNRLGRYDRNGGKVWNGSSYADPAASCGVTNGTAIVGSYAPNAWGSTTCPATCGNGALTGTRTTSTRAAVFYIAALAKPQPLSATERSQMNSISRVFNPQIYTNLHKCFLICGIL